MEFKVNLLNEFLKIRQGYFTSVNTVIDEITQNAQRAGATWIEIKYKPESIEITDNGIGCDSAEALLTKSQSGWSQNVMESQNPAGEGFYATAMIADRVTFKSKVSLRFDFGKLFESKTLDVIENLPDITLVGSTITLENLVEPIDEIKESWSRHVADNLHYVPMQIIITDTDMTQSIYGNGIDGLKKSIKESHIYNTILDTEDYTFMFDSTSQKTKIFYQSRLVTTVRDFFGGYFFVKGQAIDVRLPDRKDIVYNNKYDNIRSIISKNLINHISDNIPYECINDTIKNAIDNLSAAQIYEAFNGKQIAYHFNSKTHLTFADFEQFNNQKVYFVDNLEGSQSLNLQEIAENNVHNGNQVVKIISPFRYVVKHKFNVDFNSAAFSAFNKKYDCRDRYTTVDFIKYVADFTEYLKNRGYNVKDYSIEVGTFLDSNGNEVFKGLKKGNGEILLHSEAPVNLKGKKRVERFILENLDTFVHEFAHHIFDTDDETTHHYKSMTYLFVEWNNFFNGVK